MFLIIVESPLGSMNGFHECDHLISRPKMWEILNVDMFLSLQM